MSHIVPQTQTLINALHGYVLVKDMESQYMYCGTSIVELFNIENQEEICLYNDFSIPHEVNKYGELFLTQDEMVKSKEEIRGVYSIYHSGKLRAHQFYKSIVTNLIKGRSLNLAQSIEIKDRILAEAINNLSM